MKLTVLNLCLGATLFFCPPLSSAQTPQLLKDIRAGSNSGSPREFVNLGGQTYFAADDDGSNYGERWQLWRTDGTASGTVKVTTLPGRLTWLTAVGSRLFFVVGEEYFSQALYVSDGTTEGTLAVISTSFAENLTAVGSLLFYTDNSSVMRSDGTETGTFALTGYANSLVAGDGVVYYVNNSGKEPWKSDGTLPGTVMIKDIVPGAGGSNPRYLKFWNGKLYFQANNQIWRSDGTAVGTEQLDTGSSLTSAGPFCPAGGHLYFGAVNSGTRTLCRTNGEIGNVELLGSHPSLLLSNFSGELLHPQGAREVGGKIVFEGRNIDGYTSYTTALWSWDSVNGIVHLEDVDRWDDLYPDAARAWDHVFQVGGQMFFPSSSIYYGRSDGTSAGTTYNAFANFDWTITGISPPPGNDAILRPEGILYSGFGAGIGTELYFFPVTASPSAQEAWRQLHFGTTSNTGDAADLVDFDNDGLVNLMEFALGSHPKLAKSQAGGGYHAGSAFEFSYQRANAAVSSGFQFLVEWNDALTGVWSTAGVSEVVLSDNGTLQQVKASLPTGSQGRRFVRLRVVAP